MGDSLLSLIKRFDLAAFSTDLLQVVEVGLGDGCNVAAAEDTDLEVVWFLLAIFAGNLCACPLKIF